MKANPFDPGALPIELSDAAKRKLASYGREELLAMILANLALSETRKRVQITLSMDTSAYTAGDVLADTQEIAGALRNAGGSALLESVVLLDLDDQTAAQIDLVFFNADVSLGTENAAPSITDGDAAAVLGIVAVPSANFIDAGGAKVATVLNIGLPVSAAAGTSIYVAAIARGTPTQTAAGIKVAFGFRQD